MIEIRGYPAPIADGQAVTPRPTRGRSARIDGAGPAGPLIQRVEAVAEFPLAKVVGKGPMGYSKCVEFWGSEVEISNDFPIDIS